MLSATELAAMKVTRQSAMPDRADIRRPAAPDTTSGDFGERPHQAGALTLVASGVVCRKQSPQSPRSLQAREALAKVTDQTLWEVVFPAATDVRFGDTLTIAGVAHVVQAVLAPGVWETGRAAVVVEKLT